MNGTTNTLDNIAELLLNGGAALPPPPPPEPTVEELKAQVASLVAGKAYFQKLLEEARKPDYQLRRVMARVLSDAKNVSDLEPDVDVQPMYDRLIELVENDDDDVWTPERDFDVTVKILVSVTGTVKAKTEDEAREKVEEYLPELDISEEGAVDGAAVFDQDFRDVIVD